MKMENKQNILAAALAWVGALAIALPLAAQETTPPNMPARNPWLQDSIYPMTHYNPAQTDSTLYAGPSKGAKLTGPRFGPGRSIQSYQQRVIIGAAIKYQ